MARSRSPKQHRARVPTGSVYSRWLGDLTQIKALIPERHYIVPGNAGEAAMSLDAGTLDALKARLEHDHASMRARVHTELVDRASLSWSASNVGVPDRAEAAALDVDTDTALARLVRDYATLESLEAALDRMRSGRYGECIDCGAEIEPERLLYQPSVARCFNCAVRHEADRRAAKPTL